MSKYYFYKMTYDTGFAPNPFGKYLTLATCTPNHSRSRVQVGDYIVGVEALGLARERIKAKYKTDVEQSLIYVAKISEVLTLDEYFKDIRFKYKKILHDKTWKEKMGDNVYFEENNIWKWTRGHRHDWKRDHQSSNQFFHNSKLDEIFHNKDKNGYDALAQDIRGNRVFISKEFRYFGDKCVPYEMKFLNMLRPRQGIKCNHDKKELDAFQEYIENIENKYKIGMHGNPINCHIDDYCKEDKPTIEKSCRSK